MNIQNPNIKNTHTEKKKTTYKHLLIWLKTLGEVPCTVKVLDSVTDKALYLKLRKWTSGRGWRAVSGEAGESQPALTRMRVEFSSKPGQTSTQEARPPAQVFKGDRTLVSLTWWKSTPNENILHLPPGLILIKYKVLTCITSTMQNLRNDLGGYFQVFPYQT